MSAARTLTISQPGRPDQVLQVALAAMISISDGQSVVSIGPTATADQQQHDTARIAPSYFTSTDLKAAVAEAKPEYEVECDGEHIEGSGTKQPPVQFGTSGDGAIVNAIDQAHPYWASGGLSSDQVTAMQEAAPALKQVLAAPDEDKLKEWKSGKATTDPTSMQMLIYLIGPGGAASKREVELYETYFYREFGNTGAHGSKVLSPADYDRVVHRFG